MWIRDSMTIGDLSIPRILSIITMYRIDLVYRTGHRRLHTLITLKFLRIKLLLQHNNHKDENLMEMPNSHNNSKHFSKILLNHPVLSKTELLTSVNQ